MLIKGLPVEEILRLPDWCFGAQRISSCYAEASAGDYAWDISEMAFPDVGLLWEIGIVATYFSAKTCYVRLALGDSLPTSHEEFMTLGSLVHGLGKPGPEPREIPLYQYSGTVVMCLRDLVQPQSRRLVVEAYAPAGEFTQVHAWAVVSSFPKEVPDWLFSRQAKSQ